MSRVITFLSRVFSLSPEARAFFYVTSLLHVALKVLLGLSLVFEDNYGFRSMLAPPQSLMLASADIAMCFAISKLLDLAVRRSRMRLVQSVLLLPLFLFLVTNFIVHSYFKAFVNRGLLAFNGAGTVELTDYAVAGLSIYAVSFIVVSMFASLGFAARFRQITSSRFVARGHLPTWILFTSFAAGGYVGTLSAGQCGWLSKTPSFDLLRSYTTAQASATVSATAEQAAQFRDPVKPLYGSYDSKLDVAVPSQRGKNVLFVLIESLPFEQTPLGGAEGGLTVLSELAENGVTFTNFRTVFPATSRSFLTYHCGIYPNAGESTPTKYAPRYRCESVLDLLKGHGYRTGFFTAPMFTYDNLHKSALMKGYDEYQDLLSLRDDAKNGAFNVPAVEEEAVAEKLLEFTRKDRDKPFFATYFMFWNHAPYRLPFEDIGHLSPHARYRRTLEYLDGVLRNVIARLKADGLLDNTVLVVAADHGEGFGLHHQNHNHVGHIYEDDVRVPLLVHVPGLGKHVTARSGSNVDFAPTLAGLLELPRLPSWQGQDLLASSYTPRPVMLFGRASFATNGIVDGQYKYIEYVGTDQRHLFDLARDPHEQTDLLAREPEKARSYAELIQNWLPVVDYRAWALSQP